MKVRLLPQQIQKQVLAPTMQQSIEVLLLPLMDLSIAIEQELQNNPLLEEKEETPETDSEQDIREKLENILNHTDTYYFASNSDDEILEENPIQREICLEESLLQQLRVELSDPLEIKIGELIIGDLDDAGYLKSTVPEIAQAAETTDIDLVEHVLNTIQNFDPIGIASRDLKECLLIQVKLKTYRNNELISHIVESYLNELGNKKFYEISKNLSVSIDEIKEAARIISNLEPMPARNYRPISVNTYIKPDVIIIKNEEGKHVIHLNDEGVPALRINPFYRKLINTPEASDTEKEFIREKLKNALYFIKSIDQRNQTLRKISEYILGKQEDFFEEGHMSLTPMTLKDVGEAIDRNESTISRAISNKYIDTPKGIFPLKFFFSQGVSENGNGFVASRGIKEEIKELIESEDKSSPLSDQDIVKYFEEKGMSIARRTISKYRQTLKILPSYLRKE